MHANPTSLSKEQTLSMNDDNDNDAGGSSGELNNEAPGENSNVETLAGQIEEVSESVASNSLESSEPAKLQNIASEPATQIPSRISAVGVSSPKRNLSTPQSCNSWIDDLIEFKETALPAEVSKMSIAEALYKLEASKGGLG